MRTLERALQQLLALLSRVARRPPRAGGGTGSPWRPPVIPRTPASPSHSEQLPTWQCIVLILILVLTLSQARRSWQSWPASRGKSLCQCYCWVPLPVLFDSSLSNQLLDLPMWCAPPLCCTKANCNESLSVNHISSTHRAAGHFRLVLNRRRFANATYYYYARRHNTENLLFGLLSVGL